MSLKPLVLVLAMSDFTYPLNYELYTPDELAFIIGFIDAVEAMHHEDKIPCSTLKQKHQMYRQIIRNQTEEKRIDQELKKSLGFTVHDVLKRCP
jgi:uncharacterized protein YktA (UPF0223 family)